MRVTRINEPRCPCCGRGEVSGYIYPACATAVSRHGMSFHDAHNLLCRVGGFSSDLCSTCEDAP